MLLSVQSGGPFYAVELGRLDGRTSTKTSVRKHLPHPDFKVDQLKAMFAKYGLSLTDLVALSGAHTIGFSHCDRFNHRIHNFKSKNRVDPTMNLDYAMSLRKQCPKNVDPRTAITLDPSTPQRFDNMYYKNLEQGRGLLTSDQCLFTDTRTRHIVNYFAANNTAFRHAFVAAITKLGRVGVKTGNQGEIRRDCTAVNY